MRLDQPLVQLPISFCADSLAAEVRNLAAEAWVPHPQRFEGNEYVPLVSPGGQITGEFAGPMAMTPYLKRCSYMMEVMASLDCVWGRSRLMGLGPGADVPEHVDINYYWRTHVRVHIPIVTNPEVAFTCAGTTVNMAAGECWVFDTFQNHAVHNGGDAQRIHLVLDTVGGERLWDAIAAARDGRDQERHLLRPGTLAGAPVRVEQHNYPSIMTPWEMRIHFEELLALAIDAPPLALVRQRLDRLATGWTGAWAEFGDDAAGIPTYRAMIQSAQQDLERIGGQGIMLDNDRTLYHVLQRFIFDSAIESDRARESKATARDAGQRRVS
jgi:hypothetical protein